MRFYTQEEAKYLVEYFDKFKRENLLLVSPLTNSDILDTKPIKFSDFKKKYKLNYGDDTYEPYIDMLNEGLTGVNNDEVEYNITHPEDVRYPIIVLGYNEEDNMTLPDMTHYTELTYTLKYFNDEYLEVIVIDKMLKPFNKDLLDKSADYYGFDEYDYSVYS